MYPVGNWMTEIKKGVNRSDSLLFNKCILINQPLKQIDQVD